MPINTIFIAETQLFPHHEGKEQTPHRVSGFFEYHREITKIRIAGLIVSK